MSDYSSFGEVSHTLASYWSHVENFEYDAAVALLTDDVDLKTVASVKGRDAVSAMLEKRPRNLVVRHLLTNFIVDQDGSTYKVRHTLTGIGRLSQEGETRPFPPGAIAVVADVGVTLERSEHGLRISRLVSDVLFQQPH